MDAPRRAFRRRGLADWIALAALLVGLEPGQSGLDWIMYLQDPYDPTSLHPEAQALKRQCTVHGQAVPLHGSSGIGMVRPQVAVAAARPPFASDLD